VFDVASRQLPEFYCKFHWHCNYTVISLIFRSEFRPEPRFSVDPAIRVNLGQNLVWIRSSLSQLSRVTGLSQSFDSIQSSTLARDVDCYEHSLISKSDQNQTSNVRNL
jgi:hypothetical protein